MDKYINLPYPCLNSILCIKDYVNKPSILSNDNEFIKNDVFTFIKNTQHKTSQLFKYLETYYNNETKNNTNHDSIWNKLSKLIKNSLYQIEGETQTETTINDDDSTSDTTNDDSKNLLKREAVMLIDSINKYIYDFDYNLNKNIIKHLTVIIDTTHKIINCIKNNNYKELNSLINIIKNNLTSIVNEKNLFESAKNTQ